MNIIRRRNNWAFSMNWKNEFILIILIIYSLSMPVQGKSFVDDVNVSIKSIEFERDYFIFGIKYYAVVNYVIINNGNENKNVLIEFTNNDGKVLKTKEMYIGPRSTNEEETGVRIGTFFYITWGKELEEIFITLRNNEIQNMIAD